MLGQSAVGLEGVRMAKLVNQPLRTFRLFHNPLTIVLADGSTQLVVIHGRTVLAFAPQSGNSDTVFDFKDST